MLRAGELTSVWVPDAEQEALRDLTRAREDMKAIELKARQRLGAFLLRHGQVFRGKSRWTQAHWRWLETVKFDSPVQQVVLVEYIEAVKRAQRQVATLETQMREALTDWSLRPVAEAIATFGKVDIAVSNVSRRLHKPFETITIDDWDWAIRTNLSSCFYLAHEVVPGMKARGWGRIIHVSGYDGFTGHLTNRAYNIAAKSGMHGLSKAIGKELGPHGITANTLVPGAIDTSRDWSQYPNTIVEDVKARIPLRRWGHVDDLAYGAVYLCTTGGFVNGQALHLNGGDHMF